MSTDSTLFKYTFTYKIATYKMHAVFVVTDNTGQKLKAYFFNVDSLKKAGEFENTLRICMELSQIDSVYIEKVHELINTKDSLVLITEFYSHMTLDGYIESLKKIDSTICVRISRCLFEGLYQLHKRNIPHFNIYPESIMVDENFNVQLGNFGFYSKVMDSNGTETQSKKEINFSPPELLMDDGSYDPKTADVWSLGIILYMLTENRYPFDNNNNIKLANNILNAKYIVIHHLNECFDEALKRCFVIDPKERGTAHEIMIKLKCAENSPIKRVFIKTKTMPSIQKFAAPLQDPGSARVSKLHVRTRLSHDEVKISRIIPKRLHAIHSTFF